jgi:hypothetical protein
MGGTGLSVRFFQELTLSALKYRAIELLGSAEAV